MKDPYAALARGNAVRSQRAELRRLVSDGTVCASVIVAAPPAALRNMPLWEFLDWLPWIGPARARRMALGVAPELTTLGDLAPLPRRVLAQRLLARNIILTLGVEAVAA